MNHHLTETSRELRRRQAALVVAFVAGNMDRRTDALREMSRARLAWALARTASSR